MSESKYIYLSWILLAILLLPAASPAGTNTNSAISVDAVSPDLAAEARKVPLRGDFRLNGLELEGIPGASDLELERFRVFTPDARIFLDDSQIPVPDNRYFKGRIAGEPGSRVLLTLRQSGELRGLILRSGELWMLGGGAGSGIVAPGLSSRRADPDLELAHRVEGFRCLTDRLPPLENELEPAVEGPQSVPVQQGAGPTYAARVAIDTDNEYFDHFGGAPAATDYAADLVAYSSTIFEDEVDTSLQISFLQLYSFPDPWQQTGCRVDLEGEINEPYDRLSELMDHWQKDHPTEERTLVHMLSGKADQCGFSRIGVLCNDAFGFGFSSGLTYEFDINNPGIGWDIMVVSHEIGHNFNSPHTHCYGGIKGNGLPAVDKCDNDEAGNPWYDCYDGIEQLPCQQGTSGCGTLMSYCYTLPPGMSNMALTFGGSVLDDSEHAYGIKPDRVPKVMHDHVVYKDGFYPGCLDPVIDGPDLTISKLGNGSGTVTSEDGGIDCGADCSETYELNTVVDLTATADPDSSTFSGWSEHTDCSDGVLTMSSSRTCTATFELVDRNLTVSKTGPGSGTVTSSPPGINCGDDCSESYQHGTGVSLIAAPDFGSELTGWSGDSDCTDGELDMSGPRSCTATFGPCSIQEEEDYSGETVGDTREYVACNRLIAGDFLIQAPGGNVTFRAGNFIVLKDGFVVESGASFRAVIGPPE